MYSGSTGNLLYVAACMHAHKHTLFLRCINMKIILIIYFPLCNISIGELFKIWSYIVIIPSPVMGRFNSLILEYNHKF